jgi:hypothetical protein
MPSEANGIRVFSDYTYTVQIRKGTSTWVDDTFTANLVGNTIDIDIDTDVTSLLTAIAGDLITVQVKYAYNDNAGITGNTPYVISNTETLILPPLVNW